MTIPVSPDADQRARGFFVARACHQKRTYRSMIAAFQVLVTMDRQGKMFKGEVMTVYECAVCKAGGYPDRFHIGHHAKRHIPEELRGEVVAEYTATGPRAKDDRMKRLKINEPAKRERTERHALPPACPAQMIQGAE